MKRRIWPYVLLVLIIAVNVAIFTQRAWILDWLRLRGYDAPSAIANLAADTTMTPRAERLFYVNHPALEDKTAFNEHCADHLEDSAVLGCYHGDRQGIYVFDITDTRLQGVEQVTAAHEMLHQAYDRLDVKEKERIQGLLQDFNDTQLKDEGIKEKLDLYREADTADLVNEMHSIFGTEVANLPAELEAYYQQYFTDRSKVVRYAQSYRAEFDKLKDQVAAFDEQLSALEKEIETEKSQLEVSLEALRAKESQVQALRGNAEIYNAGVRTYNGMIETYNDRVRNVRTKIDQYNDIVAKRNDIAFAERQLQQALDSRLTPVTQ